MGVLFLLSIPTICGYFAHTRGRSFWLWFGLGFILPGIAHLILVFLPDKSDPFEKELQAIRIANGMLGTRPLSPVEKRFRKLIRGKKHTIRFYCQIAPYSQLPAAQISIDGEPLLERLAKSERILRYYRFEPLPISLLIPPSNHLLGDPVAPYQNCHRRSTIFVHRNLEGVPTAQIRVKIDPQVDCIIWHEFVIEHLGVERPLKSMKALVFNRLQYIEALDYLAEIRA
ncbi:MAG: hypothetical protein RMJ44_01620 [Cytophagales bacterium]|nr:hypothetical protein [Bernardetiaceae bacterium]MDW8209760.1 hypothetical protein [Cytophagales bacterium]